MLDKNSLPFRVEKQLLEKLRQRYRVLVTADWPSGNGHGPRLEGKDDDGLTMPDSQFFGEKRFGWLEIKCKKTFSHFFNWDRDEHGIDEDKYLHYLSIQRETYLPVYILIAEIETGLLLMQDLSTLDTVGNPRRGVWNNNGKASYNWDRRAFVKVGNWCQEPFTDDLAVSWDWDTLDGFFSQLRLPMEVT